MTFFGMVLESLKFEQQGGSARRAKSQTLAVVK